MWGLFAFWLFVSVAQAAELPGKSAVASAHPLATSAGIEILEQGGNAFDAAVTVSAVLAVVEPYNSGLGSGGFWLIHRQRDGMQVMIDGRETAPLAARPDMYLDPQGKPTPGVSINGALAAGIPGEPAALAHIANSYGSLPLARTLAPAIAIAEQGFPVDSHYRDMARFRLDVLHADKAAREQYLVDGEVPPLGYVLKQPDLAGTLKMLAEEGHDGFYRGALAKRLVAGVRAAGGIWTERDLGQYRVIEREPVVGEFAGYRVVSAALPSSGGIVLVEMLNQLSELGYLEATANNRLHLLIEVMRRAYRDRAMYLGDSDFVEVPVDDLLSRSHARKLASSVDPEGATPSEFLQMDQAQGSDTTHFSILDRNGNRVAATLSANYPFGSGVVAPGTGVLLNDQMDDFSRKPGTPNVYGLIGNAANAIAPGKRMLSSMSPTFVESEERVGILGTPGGSRIITMVLQGILEMIQGSGPEQWVSRKRIHHQYLPDLVYLEPGALDEGQTQWLESLGHVLKQSRRPWGNMQAILWDKSTGSVQAASDPRGLGKAIVH